MIKLDLGANKISDINILEKVDFKELKELNLNHNEISDISILRKANFEELEELFMIANQINTEENKTTIEYLESIINLFCI